MIRAKIFHGYLLETRLVDYIHSPRAMCDEHKTKKSRSRTNFRTSNRIHWNQLVFEQHWNTFYSLIKNSSHKSLLASYI